MPLNNDYPIVEYAHTRAINDTKNIGKMKLAEDVFCPCNLCKFWPQFKTKDLSLL